MNTPEPAQPGSSFDASAPGRLEVSPSLPKPLFPFWLPPLLYLVLATLFLGRAVFTGEAFLPARILGHLAPYASVIPAEELPPWNPLRYDGIGQFYPWRHFAAETIRSGRLPLWNPYQFCGTPFVANSQSAVFYPGNLLFFLLPTATGFTVNALLHLTLCGWFIYLFLRRLNVSELPALLGGIVYAYSAWQVQWLQLPTFLATSCWFPLLLRQVHILLKEPVQNKRFIASLALVVGLMLLAGHLQIAFYGLLAGILWAVTLLLADAKKAGLVGMLRGLTGCTAALALGLCLAAPQVLPSLELSRVSHRVGKPTSEGYAAYTSYALPPAGLAALTLPDFFGNDYDANNRYWGFYRSPDGRVARHNAAETANYIGIVTLLLGTLALLRSFAKAERNRAVWFFGGLSLLALLLAVGTPLNALFYFGVPGFGQSGSPARILVLWSLGWAFLAAFGLESLLRRLPDKKETVLVFGTLAFVFAVGLSMAAQGIASVPQNAGVPVLGDVFARLTENWLRLALMTTAGVVLFFGGKRLVETNQKGVPVGAILALAAVVLDLFWWGIRINPTAPTTAIYPVTPGLKLLQERTGHERIFPVNQEWSLYHEFPPSLTVRNRERVPGYRAVLPPNAGMVYGLRDVQGYDSLLTGQYKAFANQFARPNAAGIRDASPLEVGNIVFFQDPTTPLFPTLSAAFVVTPPTMDNGFHAEAAPSGSPVYDVPKEMAIFETPTALPRAFLQNAAGTNTGTVQWQEDSATRVTLATQSDSASRLRLNDQFFPGWHAALNGQEVPISRPSEAPVFREIPVPAGTHTVTFRYAPTSFRFGLYLACFAIFLLSFLGFRRAR